MSKTAPLWSLCSLNDHVLPESTPPDYEFEYVDISNVEQNYIANDLEIYSFKAAPSRARRLAEPGDLIVSTVRTYLRAIAQVQPAERSRVYSTGFAVLHPIQNRADSRYLSYVLTSDVVVDEIVAASTGVSYPAIQGSELHRLRIPFHNLQTQRRIADYLDRETSQIDAMIDKLGELETTLASRRADAISTELVNYQKVALGVNCKIFNGSTPSRSNTSYWSDSSGIPWLNSSVVNQEVVLESDQYVTHLALEKCHLPSVAAGDLLIGITGQGRTRGMVTKSGIDCTISQHLAAIRPTQSWESDFLHYALSSEYGELRKQSDWGGSTRGAITIEFLSRYRVAQPPLEEQRRIADHLDDVTSKIDAMLAKVAQLKDLLTERRAALITDVVTGRKEVA